MYCKRYMYDAGRKGSLELIENGFVTAFEETLGLMEMNQRILKKAGHGLDKEKPQDFRKDFDAMHAIMEMLRKSEEAQRAGALEDSYTARMELADHFIKLKGYHWLVEYLYKSCNRMLDARNPEQARLMINVFKLLGLLEEKRDDPDVALGYLERAVKTADEIPLESGDPMRSELFQHLIRMYRNLGNEYLDKEHDRSDVKCSKSIRCYKKAASLAKKNDTAESQAASYGLLGRARMKFHDNKRALKNFEKYLSLSKECNDIHGICNALFAISEMHKRMGDLARSTEALTECQERAKENGFLIPLIFASISFGQLDTARRKYLQAYEHFETAYRTLIFFEEGLLSIADLRKLCRVMCGIGRAHRTFDRLIAVLQEPPEKALGQLLAWRNKGGAFDGTMVLKQDHLIDLNEEGREDEDTKRSILIRQLMEEELNQVPTQRE